MPHAPGTGSRAKTSLQYVLPQAEAHSDTLLLYYKYARTDAEAEAKAQLDICRGLSLSGRVLVAEEGINGTVSGAKAACERYIAAMCAHPVFRMKPEDFKESPSAGSADPFSGEMFVLVVDEIISTNGVFTNIPIEETGKGYLTPEEWREALAAAGDDTVLIDVRNKNEVALGHFAGARDPKTRSFAEFPQFVSRHAEELKGKRVLMYCTGGVRCEKATAFVRAAGVAREVLHLQGGIHKYLDAFGEDGVWQGRNFVFDRRGTQSGQEASRFCVGRCVGCDAPWEELDGSAACAVCKEPVLACDACRRGSVPEFHCDDHSFLRSCFFLDLSPFTAEQLVKQRADLDRLLAAVQKGQKGAQRRKTIRRQAERVDSALAALRGDGAASAAGSCDDGGGGAAPSPAGDSTPVRTVVLEVAAAFPADRAAAKRAWPVRVWPLSARPWAFIREVAAQAAAPEEAAASSEEHNTLQVEAPVVRDDYGCRLAPGGAPARTRFRVLAGSSGSTGLAGGAAESYSTTVEATGAEKNDAARPPARS